MTAEPSARWLRGADAPLVIAVCAARTGRAQFHAGLYHRDHDRPRVLHFAWDGDLRNDPVRDFSAREPVAVALALDDDDAQTLAALCRRVARRHRADLRYRLAEWRPWFELATADVGPEPVDERFGFTCATFVLAMLRSAVADEFLALEQWPVPAPDSPDERWQRTLTARLCEGEASREVIEAVVAGIGSRRVLPTDVAGGAMAEREAWPVAFIQARRAGDLIASSLL